MNFNKAKNYFIDQCSSINNENETIELFYRTIEHLSGLNKSVLLLNPSLEIDINLLNIIIEELKKEKPIQYILGHEWFGNIKLKVNEHTLIPRPETEELVIWILNTMKEENNHTPFIIDIGTGSGCIPIYLKKSIPNAEVLAMDINQKTLDVAIENAKTHNTTIDFFQDDILNMFHSFSEKFDCIISNPPYILEEEKQKMSYQVIGYEPHEALFVTNQDPLQFYKAIINFAKENLKKDGFLFFETHQDYSNDVFELCKENGFHPILKKDMYDNDRMVKGVLGY